VPLRRIRYVHQELRHVRKSLDERALFFPLDREAPDSLIEPLGHIEIAVRTNRKAGGSLELAIDYYPRLELAARSFLRHVVGEDAAGAGSADVERVAMQKQMHGFRELLPPRMRGTSRPVFSS